MRLTEFFDFINQKKKPTPLEMKSLYCHLTLTNKIQDYRREYQRSKMKTIKWNDLKFEHHPVLKNNEFGVQCKVKFENGEWCSIIGGETSFYGDGVTSFEIYSSSTKKTSRGVKGWLSKTQVLRLLNYLKNK